MAQAQSATQPCRPRQSRWPRRFATASTSCATTRSTTMCAATASSSTISSPVLRIAAVQAGVAGRRPSRRADRLARGTSRRRPRSRGLPLAALQSYRLDLRMASPQPSRPCRPGPARNRCSHARPCTTCTWGRWTREDQLAMEFLAAPDATRARRSRAGATARDRRDSRSLGRQRGRSTSGTSAVASDCANIVRSPRAGGWPTLPDGPTLKPGLMTRAWLSCDSDSQSRKTWRRLPSTRSARRRRSLYDAALAQACSISRTRHGLAADGAVGPDARRTERSGRRAHRPDPGQSRTRPLDAARDQGRVRAGRRRGLLRFLLPRRRAGLDVALVVGRDERETPIFRSTITYVVFNPTWTIPPGILVKDKLPELQRNPGALSACTSACSTAAAARSIRTRSTGTATAARLPPYQFRQDPGPDNALGLVKIMFPNPYLVYLHDSPAKSLYDQDQRTFSSGCIRVQKPFELAELVLNDPQWNQQAIADVIDQGDADGESREARAGADPVLDRPATARRAGHFPQGHLRARCSDARRARQRLPAAGPVALSRAPAAETGQKEGR